MEDQLVTLCSMMMEQEVQIRALSDLSTTIVRAHMAFREHHSSLRQQFTDLRTCLENKGLLEEGEIRRPPDVEPDPVNDLRIPLNKPSGLTSTLAAARFRHSFECLPWGAFRVAGWNVSAASGVKQMGRLSSTCKQGYVVLWPLLSIGPNAWSRPPQPKGPRQRPVPQVSNGVPGHPMTQDIPSSVFGASMGGLGTSSGSRQGAATGFHRDVEDRPPSKPPQPRRVIPVPKLNLSGVQALGSGDTTPDESSDRSKLTNNPHHPVSHFTPMSRPPQQGPHDWYVHEAPGREEDDQSQSYYESDEEDRSPPRGEVLDYRQDSRSAGTPCSLLGGLRLPVRLQGLQQRPDLNGQDGELVGVMPGGGRMLVTTYSGESVRVRKSNLILMRSQREGGAIPGEIFFSQPLEGLGLPVSLEIPEPRKRPQRLYIVGGCSGVKELPFAEVFNMSTGRFEASKEAVLRGPRFYTSTVALSGSLFVVGGFDGVRAAKAMLRFDTVSGVWEPLPNMSRPRTFASSALVGGYIYVAGGCISGSKLHGEETSISLSWGGGAATSSDPFAGVGPTPSRLSRQVAHASAERYSVRHRIWQLLPNMSQPRAFGVAAPLTQKHFLICGGYDNRVLLGTECYVPGENGVPGEWKRLPDMQHGGFLVAQAQDELGHLYVCGGAGDACTEPHKRNGLRHAQRFHCVLNIWELLPPMQNERVGATAAAVGNGRICVCGGFGYGPQAYTSAELFDPEASLWSYLPPMHEGRSFHVAHVASAEGKLYVFGGKAGQRVLRSGECYHFSTETWEELPDMPAPRTGASLHVV